MGALLDHFVQAADHQRSEVELFRSGQTSATSIASKRGKPTGAYVKIVGQSPCTKKSLSRSL